MIWILAIMVAVSLPALFVAVVGSVAKAVFILLQAAFISASFVVMFGATYILGTL